MKIIIFRLCLIMGISLIISCTGSPPKPSESTTVAVHIPFTEAEKKEYQLALKNMNAGEFEKAQKTLVKLGKVHQGNLEVWINLANAYYKNNKLEEASATLAYVREINPEVADSHNLSGLIAVEQGDYKAAEKSYLAALAINKAHANAHYNLALIYDIFYQDLSKAITHYEYYLKLTAQEDKDTLNWVNELKLSLKRKGN